MKARIQFGLVVELGIATPVEKMAEEAAEHLRAFIIAHPEVIHKVSTVGDVTRGMDRYEINMTAKDRHDLAR